MADVTIRVRLDAGTRGTLATMLPAAVARAIVTANAKIKAYWKTIAPVSTEAKGWKDTMRYGPRGWLKQSFGSFITQGPTATIHMRWPTPYASIADKGSIPHNIAGNPLLHFKSRFGTWHRTPLVKHPGYTGHFFSEEMRIVAPQFLKEAIIQELQGVSP